MSSAPAGEEEESEERAPFSARLRGGLPIAGWLRTYRPEWVRGDAIAGVTLAAYAVPVSLAYATIAGLPPERGLYGYLFAAIYCLFGTSRQLALGPTSAISLVIGTAIAEQAGSDAERAVAIGSLAALLVGAIAVAAWWLRLGSVVNFVSETVLAGFKVGAALVIASTQLPKLFGLAAQGDGFFVRMAHLAGDLPAAHPWALAVGAGALALILLGERFLPNRPVALGVAAMSIAATALFDLEGRGVHVVGAVPSGLPVRGLFDPAELVFLWRASRAEFRVAVVALIGVLTLGVLRGVVVASILSLITLIRRAEHPPMAVLGRVAGTDRFRNLENHPEAERIPGVLVFRVEGGLVYFNVENVRAQLLRCVEEAAEPVRLVVFDLAAVPHVDLAGARFLATLRDELAARGTRLVLGEARRSARDALRRADVEQGLGPLDRRWSIAELLEREAAAP